MKKQLLLPAFFFISIIAIAQKATVNWGSEFKMRKGSTELSVIKADSEGVFLKESHSALKSYFVIGATLRLSATLVKLNKNLEEIYRSDFDKELKGKEFEDFYFLNDKLFLLAMDYNKSDKRLSLYASEINKKSGGLSSTWKELDSWYKESNKDEIDFRVGYNNDSTKMVIVSRVLAKEKNEYFVREFDATLKPTTKKLKITNEFDANTFKLEDVLITNNGNITMIGREYEYREGKKKKAKFLDFKNYLIRIYKPDGKLLKELNMEVNAKWLMSTKLMQIKDKAIVLAGYYSNTKKGKEINGMLVQRINPEDGTIISTSEKELNTSLINIEDEEDEEETKEERKERERLEKLRDEEDGFSRYYRFRNFIPTDDGGVIILAESYNTFTRTATTPRSNFAPSVTSFYTVFQSGDMMISKVDNTGNLSWLNVVPKLQNETLAHGYSAGGGGFGLDNYFSHSSGLPYYSGFVSMPVAGKNAIAVFLNDNKANADVVTLGKKRRIVSNFNKSHCFMLTIDADKGSVNRKFIFSNNDIPPATIRLGVELDNNLYVVGRQNRSLGKTKIVVGKIVVK